MFISDVGICFYLYLYIIIDFTGYIILLRFTYSTGKYWLKLRTLIL